jgi:hypothetical protein
MLDPKAITELVEKQIAATVDQQVAEVFATNEWLEPIEQKIVKYTQDRILGKFSNSSALPEIVDAVKVSVGDLFSSGKIPGIDQYVDNNVIKQSIDLAVESIIGTAIQDMGRDPVWLEKIERMINQAVVQRTVAGLTSIDINAIIRQRVDENMSTVEKNITAKTKKHGIQDSAKQCELTVMDEHVVVENSLTTNHLEVVTSAKIKDLSVTGSINVDNRSWQVLSQDISQKTLNQLTPEWKETLVKQVTEEIQNNGIEFNQLRIDGEIVIAGDKLSRKVTQSNLQSVGILKGLTVDGEAHINNTVNILNKRIGINTQEPEMALSVWDEEVSILTGKFKNQVGYVGTGRAQGLAIGVNREPAIEIDIDGLTAVKKLRVGLHRIGHGNDVPNYSGTKGDVVFNANPNLNSPVFAWVCLGGFKWKVIKAVE